MSQISELLLPWFYEHKRDLPWRKDRDPYHVWLSEIMLQQTRVEAVKEYYKRFLRELPTVSDLASCPDDKLMKLWEGLGYYNRARNLKIAATTIMTDYRGEFPQDIERIRSLKGIGDYTAGAIGSICFDLKTPAVDGNVLRVLSRVYNDDSNIDLASTKKKYRERLLELYPKEACGDFTQSLMELGALICIPNGLPKCSECPLKSICEAHRLERTHLLPVRSEKRKRKHVDMTVYVLSYVNSNERYFAIKKREEKGLLHGLYEFYNVTEAMDTKQAMAYLSEQGISARELLKEVKYTHVFTHVEWHMTAYYVSCKEMNDQFLWVHEKELRGAYALPTAFRVFVEERGSDEYDLFRSTD